ncbi:MAG: DUF5606 domain-containing protein [Candidatus Symbiothrix sp.]|jgi:hypothetical protein|nr:DUF5606 domain-containing protein [Candidatus Symbiothrix sp.]
MLKEILSVSGKPGLFKLISQGKNMFIAESLLDHKRGPVYMRDKVISLGDISIYTEEEEEKSLREVLNNIKEKENGQPIAFDKNISTDELKKYFESVLPNFDKDRVYPSDIRKIMMWYNLLVKEGLTDFTEEKTEEENAEETAQSEENK